MKKYFVRYKETAVYPLKKEDYIYQSDIVFLVGRDSMHFKKYYEDRGMELPTRDEAIIYGYNSIKSARRTLNRVSCNYKKFKDFRVKLGTQYEVISVNYND